jgi:hypothetical protein
MPYDEMASSWSNMPAWLAQRDAGSSAGNNAGGFAGLGVATMPGLASSISTAVGSLGAGHGVPIPARSRPAAAQYPARGVGLLAASMDRQDTIMGVSIGTSLGGGAPGSHTPGSELGGFLLSHSHQSLAQSPHPMEFSPSNFFAGPPR